MNPPDIERLMNSPNPVAREEYDRELNAFLNSGANSKLLEQLRELSQAGDAPIERSSTKLRTPLVLAGIIAIAASLFVVIHLFSPSSPSMGVTAIAYHENGEPFGEPMRGSSKPGKTPAFLKLKLNADSWVAGLILIPGNPPRGIDFTKQRERRDARSVFFVTASDTPDTVALLIPKENQHAPDNIEILLFGADSEQKVRELLQELLQRFDNNAQRGASDVNLFERELRSRGVRFTYKQKWGVK